MLNLFRLFGLLGRRHRLRSFRGAGRPNSVRALRTDRGRTGNGRRLRDRRGGDRGEEGEAWTADALDALPDCVEVLHDVTLPVGKGTVQIDHIVLADTIGWTVETKNWSARTSGSADADMWIWELGGKIGEVRNPLKQAQVHASVVRRILGIPVYPMVIFVGCGFVAVRARGIWYDPERAVEYIGRVIEKKIDRDAALARHRANAIRRAALPLGEATDALHRRNVRAAEARSGEGQAGAGWT